MARPRSDALQAAVALQYAELVYFGLWFTPLREALDASLTTRRRRDRDGQASFTRATSRWSVASRIFALQPICRPSPWVTATTRKMPKASSTSWDCLPAPRALAAEKAKKRKTDEDVVRTLPRAAGPAFRTLATVLFIRSAFASVRSGRHMPTRGACRAGILTASEQIARRPEASGEKAQRPLRFLAARRPKTSTTW